MADADLTPVTGVIVGFEATSLREVADAAHEYAREMGCDCTPFVVLAHPDITADGFEKEAPQFTEILIYHEHSCPLWEPAPTERTP